MTTGEMIGIGIGVAGLGLGAWALLRKPAAPTGAVTGTAVGGPPAGWTGSWGYSQPGGATNTRPATAASSGGNLGSDIGQTINDVGQAINGVVGLFDALGSAFGW